jgi:glycosyltransferase involved in cell wall biosynthesis
MNKNTCVIYAPIQTFSGYGANARDKVKAIIEQKGKEWDIKILPCRWGNTPMNFIDENPQWKFLEEYFISQLTYQPDVMIWITIPSEAQKIGKYNILFTAGIESTLSPASWVEGCEKMDLVIGSSNHTIDILKNSRFQKHDKNTNQSIGVIEWNGNSEVLFEGVDLDVYNKENTSSNLDLSQIKEDFCFLSVGHWMQGMLGEDRKNMGLTIKSFYETFKNKKSKPALILKTSQSSSSYMDRDEILKRIKAIRETVNSKNLPNIYLVHGDLTDGEVNELYNHPKVKAMVSLTKGEGFGRPLLEFSTTSKPIIATNWSGHTDFLHPEKSILLSGNLTNVHPTAINDFLIAESKWFSVNTGEVGTYLKDVFENYKKYLVMGKKQGYHSITNFSYDKMKEKLGEIFDKNIPNFPKPVTLKLPELTLPKLTKI